MVLACVCFLHFIYTTFKSHIYYMILTNHTNDTLILNLIEVLILKAELLPWNYSYQSFFKSVEEKNTR